MSEKRQPNLNFGSLNEYLENSGYDEFAIKSAKLSFTQLGILETSQLSQDLIAYSIIGKNGKYLEIGAGDGYHLSNTFNLERFFGWSGWLIEPLPRFQRAINSLNRKNSRLLPFAISNQCGMRNLIDSGELSGFVENIFSDSWGETRERDYSDFGSHRVVTICPTQLLIRIGNTFDFVSIDTEGSEISILESWPFSISAPKLFMVENSQNPIKSKKINELLVNKGYRNILAGLSMWDSWFVREKDVESTAADYCQCNVRR
jgi:hypothetical protein